MKKSILFVLSGLGVLILLGVVAIVIVLNLDPNRYKAYLTDKISQQMGRSFEIQEDLRIDYFPWLAVEASGIFLANAPGFDDEPLFQGRPCHGPGQDPARCSENRFKWIRLF
jgi:AsmA protein